jgi:hypothetical protein
VDRAGKKNSSPNPPWIGPAKKNSGPNPSWIGPPLSTSLFVSTRPGFDREIDGVGVSPSFPRFKASGHHGHLRFEPHVLLTSSRAEEAAITTQQFESVMLVTLCKAFARVTFPFEIADVIQS